MNRPTPRFSLLRLALAASLLALPLGGCPPQDDGEITIDPRLSVHDDDHILGFASAPVTVIEYGDFQCPVCGRFFDETYPTIRADYIDTGRVRWVFRHFPLTQVHADARDAAIAAECAGAQGRFFDYHDRLFANQNDLSDAALQAHAAALSLDTASFGACFDSRATASRVDRDIADAAALNLSSTPTFFISGSRVEGFRTVAQMRVLLDQALSGQ